jgi:hypothetical protein
VSAAEVRITRAGGVLEDDALIDRVNTALDDMWRRLDALPRTDPFWARTNMRVTSYKVSGYAAQCLGRDRHDTTARWALIGFDMDAGSPGCLRLIAGAPDGRSVQDLFAVAEWLWLEIGVDPGASVEQALSGWDDAGGEMVAALRAGRSFPAAIGRQQWSLFQDALCGPGDLTEARLRLRDDPSAVTDLRDAARWWADHRDTDVSGRLAVLLDDAEPGP